jgi:hypothetical protein
VEHLFQHSQSMHLLQFAMPLQLVMLTVSSELAVLTNVPDYIWTPYSVNIDWST